MINLAKQNQYVEFAEKDSKGRNIAEKIDELTPVTVNIDFPDDYTYPGTIHLTESGAEKLATLKVGDTTNWSGPGSILGNVVEISITQIPGTATNVPLLTFVEFTGSYIQIIIIGCYANAVPSYYRYPIDTGTKLYKHTITITSVINEETYSGEVIYISPSSFQITSNQSFSSIFNSYPAFTNGRLLYTYKSIYFYIARYLSGPYTPVIVVTAKNEVPSLDIGGMYDYNTISIIVTGDTVTPL